MKRLAAAITSVVLALAAVGAVASCTKSSGVTAATIYGELVEGGCLQADDSGLGSVQQALTTSGAPAWFSCLQDGGTVASCAVPCDSGR